MTAESGYNSATPKQDKFVIWLYRSYIHIINLLVLIYVGLPFLAPVAMKTGHPLIARGIYTIYSPLCHQFPFRSLFLFGEQPYYPRAEAGLPYQITYEDVTHGEPVNILQARNFIGSEAYGYKVAICERDLALYGSILLFGVIFALSGRKLPKIKWYHWLFFGVMPIAFDGFSQIPGLLFPGIPADLIRESTPAFRYLTGALFGFFTAWFLYPYIEESMQDNVSYMVPADNANKGPA